MIKGSDNCSLLTLDVHLSFVGVVGSNLSIFLLVSRNVAFQGYVDNFVNIHIIVFRDMLDLIVLLCFKLK